MGRFAVIDTETTWRDEVMSIGVAIADSETYGLVDKRYYVIVPCKKHGGMYSHALYAGGVKPDLECPREQAMEDLARLLAKHKATAIFAYNASFDHRHLPEMRHFAWHDIMGLAAYRQHNPKIPANAECYGTGRLKSGYGVESVYRLLSGDRAYCETHNALFDAIDELRIMDMLGHGLGAYSSARIG